MVFSSLIFLWCFFPICLAGYYLLKKSCRNLFLLIVSLLFYAWGEPRAIFLMLLSIAGNYVFGLLAEKKNGIAAGKRAVAGAIVFNLALLGYYKYYDFFVENLNLMLPADNVLPIRHIALPIGISFFTFQALSYVVDVYRAAKEERRLAQRNVLNVGLYIAFFPQLIAGPIVRYEDVARQINHRQETPEMFVSGIKRFVCGVGKKVLIANTMAGLADSVFGLSIEGGQLSTVLAWMGALAYTLQIYYDFSGYSDMAIGLGRMFGFSFLENFNYPYLSSSIREFWRRWHISLSTWFREYLYIPLGGNRRGTVRTYVNLFIVFFATGLWHGANWTFVLWGLLHGFFSVAERLLSCGDGRKKRSILWNTVGHIYTLFVVVIGWVLFRSDSPAKAFLYLQRMFLYTPSSAEMPLGLFVDGEILLMLVAGVLLAGPVQQLLKGRVQLHSNDEKVRLLEGMGLVFILWLSVTYLSAGAYNPFIYFRF